MVFFTVIVGQSENDVHVPVDVVNLSMLSARFMNKKC